jgi:hypothetical protein
VRARLLADAEEREAQRLTCLAMEAMLKKLERKLLQFSALEEAVLKERAALEVPHILHLFPFTFFVPSIKVQCRVATVKASRRKRA